MPVNSGEIARYVGKRGRHSSISQPRQKWRGFYLDFLLGRSAINDASSFELDRSLD